MLDAVPEQVVVVGSTGLMSRCLALAKQLSGGIPVTSIDTSKNKKDAVMRSLCAMTGRTLVLSIANPYIFPADTVAQEHLTIVNLHRGLLPGHRGRNVLAWSIFYEETEAGATWHLVNQGIDTGRIIQTVHVPIEEDDTSLSLMRRLHAAAVDSFPALFPKLLSGQVEFEAPVDRPDYLHLSTDVPNGGALDLDWSGHKMSCFLRAMDFGVLRELGRPRIAHDGREFIIKNYAIERGVSHADGAERTEDKLVLWKDGFCFRLTLADNTDEI